MGPLYTILHEVPFSDFAYEALRILDWPLLLHLSQSLFFLSFSFADGSLCGGRHWTRGLEEMARQGREWKHSTILVEILLLLLLRYDRATNSPYAISSHISYPPSYLIARNGSNARFCKKPSDASASRFSFGRSQNMHMQAPEQNSLSRHYNTPFRSQNESPPSCSSCWLSII